MCNGGFTIGPPLMQPGLHAPFWDHGCSSEESHNDDNIARPCLCKSVQSGQLHTYTYLIYKDIIRTFYFYTCIQIYVYVYVYDFTSGFILIFSTSIPLQYDIDEAFGSRSIEETCSGTTSLPGYPQPSYILKSGNPKVEFSWSQRHQLGIAIQSINCYT